MMMDCDDQPQQHRMTYHTLDYDRLLEVSTVKSNVFKNIVEALKVVITEANLIFTPEGIRLASVDTRKYALIHLGIDRDAFEIYHVPHKVVVGLDMIHLHKIFRTIVANDTLTFFVDKSNTSKLGLLIKNSERKAVNKFMIPMLQLPEYAVCDIREFEHAPPEIHSGDFQKICRDIASMGTEVIDITLFKKQLIFSSRESVIEHEVHVDVLNHTAMGGTGAETDIIQGTFFLKFLVGFSKAVHLSPRVRVMIQNSCPLILEYQIEALAKSSLKYVLSPVKTGDMGGAV
ncbi:uncharacterized protein BJ171DRAFT_616505 [Polychytrium aggregatum]|uniref:uncharacterized protein n=1 Tax=Polychytrium aggregatum TaxID=110093 RepID=UPI0022FE7D38|nr:uncharacterized protein BJ171DRAFT_616505 [Polychytrium aggregatum]KAI9190618.1 hypothetical protein BJ171DRAFT_616505 [Polychytrium aggregatum]